MPVSRNPVGSRPLGGARRISWCSGGARVVGAICLRGCRGAVCAVLGPSLGVRRDWCVCAGHRWWRFGGCVGDMDSAKWFPSYEATSPMLLPAATHLLQLLGDSICVLGRLRHTCLPCSAAGTWRDRPTRGEHGVLVGCDCQCSTARGGFSATHPCQRQSRSPCHGHRRLRPKQDSRAGGLR